MKNYLRAAFFIFLALAILPASASAQSDKTVVVHQRNADITIQSNGDTHFLETWVTEFQNGSFTMAFRDIPTAQVRDIVDVQVLEGDQALQTDIDAGDTSTKITWHFPPTNLGANFFSDTHTFTLRYTLRGALRIYPTGDQFWWKFIEADRAYTIESSKVTLHLPNEFPTDQLKATTYLGSNASGGAKILDGKTIEFDGGPFPPKTEWEIRAQFPHVIAAAPEAWQQQLDALNITVAQNNFYAVLATLILGIGGALGLLLLWFLLGRDKPTAFAAEFLSKPPDDTPPGVVGTLLDERADMQDIVATVADLAQRGYLKIHESDAYGTPEYESLNGDTYKLAPFEQKTLDALLRGMATRRLDDVRGSFYYYLNDLQNALYDEVVTRGYFPANPLATRDLYFRIGKLGAILTPIIAFIACCVMLETAPLLFLPFVVLEILFLALLGLSRYMPKRTQKGALAAAQWNAFRRYLESLEKYTNVADAKSQFASYLPYAIAFGLEKS